MYIYVSLSTDLKLFVMKEFYKRCIVLTLLWISVGLTKELCVSNQTISFVNRIISIYGNHSKISTQQLQDTFQDFTGQTNFYDICLNSSNKSCTEDKVRDINYVINMLITSKTWI
jgi:hypothetical protein